MKDEQAMKNKRAMKDKRKREDTWTINDGRKGIDRKNQMYSILLAVILLGCLAGYFSFMLPSLYVSYRMEQNLEAVKRQHKAYVENGSYDNIKLGNPVACISLRIPDEGDSVFLVGQSWQVEVAAKEPYTKTILSEVRQFLSQCRDGEFSEDWEEEDFEKKIEEMAAGWKELVQESGDGAFALPVRLDIKYVDNKEFYAGHTKLHVISDELVIAEATVKDDVNTYTNYMAMEDTKEGMVFTILPAMMPDMNEIRPVVWGSIPMLAAAILLLVLLFSQMYSRGILQPVYRKLEEKNQALQEENKRQEIFMRASSHQLKTPIQAALLLLDGMINQVGRYKDTATYLPRAKEQLLSMRKMVEDILTLNHCRENMKLQSIRIMPLVEGKLQELGDVLSGRHLQVSCQGDKEAEILADEYLLMQIMDNLISNAVNYTPDGEKIEIRISKTCLSIENYGVTIQEELLPHIFDPFVSGNHEKNIGSHGLGLYIAAYYAKEMNLIIHIKNGMDSVLTTLDFCLVPQT